MNDELEEDEDLHNKLKYDHKISDEQITANNAKISPEIARVAQLTDESDMLEEDIAASKSKLSDATTTREKQLTEYREANKAKTEDIESSSEASAELCATTTQIDVLIAPRNTRHTMMLNRTMKVSCEYVPQYVSQGGEALGVLKQPLEEMSSDIVAAEAAELEYKETFDEVSDAKNEEIVANTQQYKEKILEAQETKISSDRNTAELARNQESLGEQFACSDAQTTYDVRHAERLAEDQTLAETIEILKEDQTDAVWELTLIRRSASLALNLSQRARKQLRREQVSLM